MKATTVKDIMTTSVVAVREEADFKEMVAALHTRRISAFPVIDDANRVIGVVSEADLLLKEAGPALAHGLGRLTQMPKERAKAAGITAVEVMTSPAVTIGADAPVTEAAALMQASRVKRLPVVDAAGRLRGIVSRADVLTVFERPDHEIWDEVVKGVIAGEIGLDPEMFAARGPHRGDGLRQAAASVRHEPGHQGRSGCDVHPHPVGRTRSGLHLGGEHPGDGGWPALDARGRASGHRHPLRPPVRPWPASRRIHSGRVRPLGHQRTSGAGLPRFARPAWHGRVPGLSQQVVSHDPTSRRRTTTRPRVSAWSASSTRRPPA